MSEQVEQLRVRLRRVLAEHGIEVAPTAAGLRCRACLVGVDPDHQAVAVYAELHAHIVERLNEAVKAAEGAIMVSEEVEPVLRAALIALGLSTPEPGE